MPENSGIPIGNIYWEKDQSMLSIVGEVVSETLLLEN